MLTNYTTDPFHFFVSFDLFVLILCRNMLSDEYIIFSEERTISFYVSNSLISLFKWHWFIFRLIENVFLFCWNVSCWTFYSFLSSIYQYVNLNDVDWLYYLYAKWYLIKWEIYSLFWQDNKEDVTSMLSLSFCLFLPYPIKTNQIDH